MARTILTPHERAVKRVVLDQLKGGAETVQVSVLQNPNLTPWVLRKYPVVRPSDVEVLDMVKHFQVEHGYGE